MIGKTIAKVEYYRLKRYDDTPYLKLSFTDGTFVFIEGGYGGYTGNSSDEYRTYIKVMPEGIRPVSIRKIK